jgi:hypothetical protein
MITIHSQTYVFWLDGLFSCGPPPDPSAALAVCSKTNEQLKLVSNPVTLISLMITSCILFNSATYQC